ncbi:type I restriction enzyme, S subunit [Oribacterium sp. KHPX15]|uniref:restriction endonuclease subunit S n=1 Tax=Oribacterium sp. KHPX15 TaxID=1855342 RepID=UPI00089BDA8E|nr:restriction endonuclease subunit S [Oribacterium sp. KHPX15]SEA04477.1 type I restriction enzyme, S subunit [Oribacterium sp. KHPX15]
MRVKLEEVCKRIYAGGDVPKDRYSEVITDEYSIPIYANAEKDEGLYGYTDEAREKELSITVAARGTIGYTAIRRTPFLPVVRLITVVPDLSKVSERYLFYALKNCKPQSSGTSIPQLTVPDIKKNRINLLDINEQELIADRLDKLNEIIKLRKEELFKLDELIQARFVELFGDPIKNPQNRKTTEFVNVVKMQRGFDLPVQDRQQDGEIPVYGSNGVLDHHDIAKIQGGGVITGRSGTIGKVFYTEGDYWPLNTTLFSVDTHGNNVVYLAYLLELFDLTRFVEGTGVPTLNRNMFHNKSIIDVDLAEQKVFAEFVKQVDKSKVAVQKSLDETQKLFDSLMQEYFG